MTDRELEREYARCEFLRGGLQERIHKHRFELGLGALADGLLAILDDPSIATDELKVMLALLTALRVLDYDREQDLARLKQLAARQRKQEYSDNCRAITLKGITDYCLRHSQAPTSEVIQ